MKLRELNGLLIFSLCLSLAKSNWKEGPRSLLMETIRSASGTTEQGAEEQSVGVE